MPNTRKYFVICEDNCKFESMTKEEILTAIQQAVEQGEIHDVDTGFVTALKEQNANAALKMWVGAQAEYNAIEEPDENTMYIITDEDGMQPIDISNLVSVTANIGADVEVEGKKFTYNKTTGIVHFSVALYLSNITADDVQIRLGGDYLPSEAAAVSFDKNGYAGKIATSGTGYILIHMPSRTATSLLISGWYFYDEQ